VAGWSEGDGPDRIATASLIGYFDFFGAPLPAATAVGPDRRFSVFSA
jgi:hypothetical protein